MVVFKLQRPRSTLADWSRHSVWARDTGGERDATGAPVRVQGGRWLEIYVRAEQQAARRRRQPLAQLRELWRGEGLSMTWWLGAIVPGAWNHKNLITVHACPCNAIIVVQLAVYSLQNRSQLLSSPCYSGFSYGHCK